MQAKKNLALASFTLLVALIILAGATYAWFTVSISPQITDTTVDMEAYHNLEIRVGTEEEVEVTFNDSNDLTKWGKSISYKTKPILQSTAVVQDGVTKGITYDDDGRTSGLIEATVKEQGTDTSAGPVDATEGATPTIYESSANKTCAVVYNVWLRSNVDQNVTCEIKFASGDGYGPFTVYLNGTEMSKEDGANKATFKMEANKQKNIKLIVFIDGEKYKAEDFASAATIKGTMYFTGDDVTGEVSIPE